MGPVAVPTVYVQRTWENPTAASSPHLIGQPSSFRTLPRFLLILHNVSVGSQVEAAPPVSVRGGKKRGMLERHPAQIEAVEKEAFKSVAMPVLATHMSHKLCGSICGHSLCSISGTSPICSLQVYTCSTVIYCMARELRRRCCKTS